MDDEVSEDNGSVTATIRADAGGRYVTGADSDHTTRLLDNDPVIISVSAVSAVVTEGTDAQFRFTRIGNTGGRHPRRPVGGRPAEDHDRRHRGHSPDQRG